MTRDEFEAAIWRTFPDATVAQIDAILDAADALSATTAAVAVEIDGKRQRPAAVHFQNPRWAVPACSYGRTDSSLTRMTTDPAEVTCARCMRSRSWRQARALAVAS